MTYEKVKNLKPEEFKRFCGVGLETFEQMVKIVKEAILFPKKIGRPSKLSTEDQILLTLEYWREDRSYFHLGQSWGINESTASSDNAKNRRDINQSKRLKIARKEEITPSRLST